MSNQNPSLNADRRSPIRGCLMQLLGATLIFIGAGCSIALVATLTPSGRKLAFDLGLGFSSYVMFILGTALIPFGKHCSRIGRQLTVFSAEQLLRHDKRSPVLYLRSFKDDVIAANVAGRNLRPELSHVPFPLIGAIRDNLSTSTEEEVLAKELMKLGPAVAVGIPGEELPELGMARMYFIDDEWQDKVLALMSHAKLVVIRAGDTEGFWWELEMSVNHLNPEKLLLLLPFETTNELTISPGPNSDEYTRFCKKAEFILPKKLPVFHGKRVPGSSLAGMIWFDSEWNPKIYAFDQLKRPLKETLRYVFKHY